MGLVATLVLAGVLGLSAQDEGPEEGPGEAQVAAPRLPPRTTIAGLAGFHARSRITFFEAPDMPHDLDALYVFPGRARLLLTALDADWHARQLEYRAGDQFFFLASRSLTSDILEGQRRAELELRMELRRALMLWPDSHAWSGEGAARSVSITDAGSLEVSLDDAGRPESMRATTPAGAELEAYSQIEWSEQYERTWPRSMTFSYGGTQVWREEVRELSVSVHYLDWYFVPADRRTPPPDFGAETQVHSVDLPPFVVRRIEIDGELAWMDLLARAAELVATASAELEALGLVVEEPVNFLLSEDGRATHCELRLKAPAQPPPPGWTAVAERPTLTVFAPGPPAGLVRLVRLLRGRAPEDAAPGRPYLRMRPSDGPGGKLQIVLPLVP